MSNMKIISIIDHENTALRSDITHAIQYAVAAATQPLEQKIEQLQKQIQQLQWKMEQPGGSQ
jgi:uncharacterized protein YybS (DUF2232 family)